jgi:hypothetical protein
MDEDFTRKAVIPGDPNYVWDKVEEFGGLQRQPSGWDDDDDEEEDSTHCLVSKVLDKQAEPTSPAVEAKVLEEDSFVQLEEVVVIPSRDPSPVNLKEEEQVLDKVKANDDANDDAKHPFDLLLETSQFQEDAYSDEDDFWK